MVRQLIPETYPMECSLVKNPKTFTRYLAKNFGRFFGVGFIFYCCFYILSRVGFALFPPVAMRMITDLLDTARIHSGRTAVIILSMILCVSLILKFADILQNWFWQRVRCQSRSRVLLDLVNYLHCQSMGFINKKMLGKLSQQSNNIALNSILILQKLFASMGSDFIILVLGFGLIARLHWIIAAFIFAEILLRLIWFRFNFRNMIATNRKTASAVSEIHGATTDTLGGGLSVRAFGGRLKELFLLNGVLKKYEDNYQRHVFADRKFWAPLSIMEEIFFVVIAGLCVWFFYQGSMDLGQVVFAIGTFVSLNSASWNFVFKWTELFESGAETAQNYTELVRNISVHDKKNPAELIVRRGRIKFDDIDFSYESRGDLVLSDFYLNISPGEHIGLVGQSGGGKSTIIKLLLRMYDVCGGKITIDGQDISAVSLDSLRRNISYIPQDTALFNRSILDNLKYANESATKSEVIRAARFAGAHDFIMQQPNGYNTVVGDRGVKLSGGQRQRIAIARAFLQNAPIILIDEATSSLDSETEGIIQQSLEYISSGKTMLVVAHRLATLMKMDRIIVLGNGRIVESGTHEQLIKQRGAYASMWKKQTIQK